MVIDDDKIALCRFYDKIKTMMTWWGDVVINADACDDDDDMVIVDDDVKHLMIIATCGPW